SAEEALKSLLAKDEGRDVRQVAMIDAQGRVAAHTGAKCIEAAGDHVGRNYSVQANLMSNGRVWPAMARAFETTKGDLAERMLADDKKLLERILSVGRPSGDTRRQRGRD